MQKNYHFNFLFLFEFPFLIIWRIIKYSLYYSIIFITLFIYFILPIKHNIFSIYKFLFFIKELIKTFCTINPQIILKSNSMFLNYSNQYIDNINFIKKDNTNYIIYTKINSFYDLLILLQLMQDNQFFLNFNNKKNFYILEKKIADFIDILQKKSLKPKQKITMRVIICSEIPDDNFFKNYYNKNKELFILSPQKNKPSLFYLINKIYTNDTI